MKVCRPCMRVVDETGGGEKYQTTKKVIEEWSKSPGVTWVPKCSKRAYEWQEVQFNSATKCFVAVSENNQER